MSITFMLFLAFWSVILCLFTISCAGLLELSEEKHCWLQYNRRDFGFGGRDFQPAADATDSIQLR